MARAMERTRPTEDDLLALATDAEQGERNLAALIERIAGYEARFGIPSSEVHQAIDRGELRETLDVCHWLIDYDLLRRAQSR